jgi:HK97 family phage major capsid protein
MSKMTAEQLNDHIKEVVLPMIAEKVGSDVKAIVEAQVEKSLTTAKKEPNGPSGLHGIFEEGSPFMDLMQQRVNAGNATPGMGVQNQKLGLGFATCVQAYAKSKIMGTGVVGVPKILKEWKRADIADVYEKALAASDAVSGGFLVPPQYSQEIIEYLRPASVVRRLGPVSIPMTTGTMRIPKVTQGATAGYIGENTNAPKTQQTFGQVQLTYKKLACLVPISNDLLRYSSPGADAIVRDDVVRAMAQAENTAFLRGDGINGSPRGLLNWVLPGGLINANASQSLQNITSDLGAAIVALMNQNIPMTKPVWIWAPRTWNYLMTIQTSNGVFPFRDELMRGTFWGWPYGTTTAVPINLSTLSRNLESEIYLSDFADAALGESLNLVVDASQEAAYSDGVNVVAAFSQDQTVIRAIQEHDFVMRRQESVAVLQGVVYGK